MIKKRILIILLIVILCVGPLVAQTVYRYNHPTRGSGIAVTGYAKIRTAAVLTTSYVSTSSVEFDQFKEICILFDITQGGLTSFEYKVWISKDGANWFQEATESVASGVITDAACYYTHALATDVAYYKVIPFNGRHIKLQVKGTGTVTGSSCSVELMGSY